MPRKPEMDEKAKEELNEQEQTIADATITEELEGELHLDLTEDQE